MQASYIGIEVLLIVVLFFNDPLLITSLPIIDKEIQLKCFHCSLVIYLFGNVSWHIRSSKNLLLANNNYHWFECWACIHTPIVQTFYDTINAFILLCTYNISGDRLFYLPIWNRINSNNVSGWWWFTFKTSPFKA